MTKSQAIQPLTKLEREILNHRLEVPDAIADAICGYDYEDVEAIAAILERGEFTEAFEYLPDLARAVLVDAVEGSTFYACAKTNCDSPQRLAAIERAIEGLEAKIGLIVEEPVVCPRW